MSKYQAYPEYKDSGVEWLGGIPEHWEVTRHKYVAVFKKGKNPDFLLDDFEDGAVRYLSMDYLRGGSTSLYALPERSSYLASKGQVLIIWDGSNAGEFVEGEDGIVSSTMAAAEYLANINKSFYWYLCQCLEPEMRRHAVGMGIPHVNGTELKNSVIVLPTKGEQENIANFLDHETAKIDTLIDKQQQLIQLLKEKRQAVISHAVTKGLNPNAPMRDSGVEWLGEVPEHWVVTRAKYLFDFITSGSRGWAEYYSDDGALFFRITNLTRNTIEPKLDSIQCVKPPYGSEGVRAKIQKNDLLISITADLGSVCVANKDVEGGYVSQHVSLCRPNRYVTSSRWLGYFILSDMAKEQLLGSGYGGTKIQLSLEDIRELWLVQPNSLEQVEIANFIDSELGKFSKLISKADYQISLLQERRTALISAAVTGKIDVRHHVSRPTGNDTSEVSA